MKKLWLALAAVIMVVFASTLCLAETNAAPKAEAKQTATAGKVNLNAATQAELEKLPGIGAASAKKIIAGRPYASVNDLAKAGLNAKTIEKITPQVTVGAAAPATALPASPAKPAAQKATVPAKTPAPPQAGSTAKTAKPATPPPAGRDMVWVNMDSKIFHKSGSKWYGKTKQGSYMSESEAIRAGYREAK